MRYATGIQRGAFAWVLSCIVGDLVATLAESRAPGDDSLPRPGFSIVFTVHLAVSPPWAC